MHQETKWWNLPTREELEAQNRSLKWVVAAWVVVAVVGWVSFAVVVCKF